MLGCLEPSGVSQQNKSTRTIKMHLKIERHRMASMMCTCVVPGLPKNGDLQILLAFIVCVDQSTAAG